ncbi:putative membrane protein [Vibrio maritimus]|uniref:Putative membrane protein n=1 Tax=Vibrio maritimus TaxID=990268 RepID=A0A090S822_9VIBR|nr:putative membrane protein [Vibrio maritimus]
MAADAEKTALQDSIKKIQEGAENGVLSEQERRDIQYKKGLIEGLTETVEKYQDKVKTGTVKELSMNESKLASEESLLAKLKKTEALYVHRLARIKEEVKYGENRIRLEEDLASGKLKVADADLMALRAQADRSDAAVAGYKAEQESIKEIEEANKRLANLSLSLAKKLGTSQGKSLNEFMSWKTASEQNSEAIREMRAQLEAATKGSLSGAQEDGLSKLQAMAREIDLNNIIIQQREYQEEIALDLSTEMQRFGYETNKTKRGLEQVKRTLERKLTTLERNTEEYWRTKDAINSVNDSLELAARNADAINPKNDAWFDLGMSIKNMSNQVDDELAGAFEGVFDSIATSIVDTESSFSDMINNLADDLASFMIKMTMMQAVQSAFPSFFANGGIMSSEGSVPLKTYATGGIATSPQVAVFGEGSHNEAYVPLPDGKTIPVTMQGGGGSAPVVNVINQTGMQAETESNARFDGERWVTDVVLKAASRPGKFRDTMNRS